MTDFSDGIGTCHFVRCQIQIFTGTFHLGCHWKVLNGIPLDRAKWHATGMCNQKMSFEMPFSLAYAGSSKLAWYSKRHSFCAFHLARSNGILLGTMHGIEDGMPYGIGT